MQKYTGSKFCAIILALFSVFYLVMVYLGSRYIYEAKRARFIKRIEDCRWE